MCSLMERNDTEFLEQLGTEQVRPELADLDQLSIADLVDVMCADVRQLPDALVAVQPQIANAVTDIVARMELGGRLVYVGAGTAGRLGMLDAAEAGPTFNVDDGQVVGVLAGGITAFGVPLENAEDDYTGGAEALKRLTLTKFDCVVGISASGRTPYVLGAIDEAKNVGALTVGLACNVGTPLGDNVQRPIEVAVGPELIAGSTRMNSGTIQKIVLNIISTATMVRLGKTYGNLMVDVRPTNEKLRDRSARIVARITGNSMEESRDALESSSWKTKVAAAMLVGHVDSATANERLDLYEGRLRPALDSLRGPSSGPRDARPWTRLGVAAAFVNGSLVPGDVAVHDGEVMAVGLSGAGAGIAIPGFVDAQVNGYAGVDLLHADVEEIVEMGRALMRDGVVAYQPTLITSEFDQTRRAATRLKEARAVRADGAVILRTHLEGPFLSPKRAGTHPLALLRDPDLELLERLLDLDDIGLMTIAPELPGALELIDRCRGREVTVSLGHSAANAAEAERGFDAGATAVTHLFNAMESLSARAPGLAGTALTRAGVTVQLIADGLHVTDEMMRLAFAAAPGRCVIVTDAIAAAASDKSVVQLGEVTVYVDSDVAQRDDGTLAGSIGKLRDSLVRLSTLGLAPADALGAVISRPAQLLGGQRHVAMTPGSPANLFVVDNDLVMTRRVTPHDIVDL
jgi:N-acetylmuramic acid 6-phosphate etherase/N-acetylglucosamine-6-phosphate deacetylase